MKFKIHSCFFVAAFIACVCGGAGMTQAGTIASFGPDPYLPSTPEFPEFVYDGSALCVGSGSTGDGSLQTAPGLKLSTPVAIPDSIYNTADKVTEPSTSFYDVTLELTGLGKDGDTGVLDLGQYQTFLQPLQSGTFAFTSTTGKLLLSGDIDNAVIGGLVGQQAGGAWTLNLSVTYTEGLILEESIYSPGDRGEFSWILLIPSSDDEGMALDASGQLAPFDANGSGEFNIIPEPVSMTIFAFSMAAMLRRKK